MQFIDELYEDINYRDIFLFIFVYFCFLVGSEGYQVINGCNIVFMEVEFSWNGMVRSFF